jgi:hypothetical protein
MRILWSAYALVYNVVDNRGEFRHRVLLPVGRSIAGFGRGGVLYLMTKSGTVWKLERARLQ